jgi:hypothetical protein
VAEQREVEDPIAVLVVDAGLAGQAGGDQAGAQALLEGLAHADVDGQRKGGDRLCQPHLGHARDYRPTRADRQGVL